MDELTLDGKMYISSKRAAKITGYARDYVGQLCREGHVEARLVGRNWYVLESSIKEHRFGVEEKPEKKETGPEKPVSPLSTWNSPTYTTDSAPILPNFPQKNASVNVFAPLGALNPEITPTYSSISADHTVAQMQSAWQDWFSRKNLPLLEKEPEETLLESPEIMDARVEIAPQIPETRVENDAMSNFHTITLQKVAEVIEEKQEKMHKEIEEESEPIPVRRSYASRTATAPTMPPVSAYKPTGRIISERKVPMGKYVTKTSQKATVRRGPSVVLTMFFVIVGLIAIAVGMIGTGYASQYTDNLVEKYSVLQYLCGESVVNKSK